MKTTRRAFLKAAAAVCGVIPCLGKDASAVPSEQTQEIPWMYDRDGQLCWRWDWTLGPWGRGRRVWQAMLIVPNHGRMKILRVMMKNTLRTNQRTFCGVRKDCLLLGGINWIAVGDEATLATVYLKEYRRAYGYANIINTSTGKRIKGRWRVYERVNFQEIMPGQHRAVCATTRTDWITAMDPKTLGQYEHDKSLRKEAMTS